MHNTIQPANLLTVATSTTLCRYGSYKVKLIQHAFIITFKKRGTQI